MMQMVRQYRRLLKDGMNGGGYVYVIKKKNVNILFFGCLVGIVYVVTVVVFTYRVV